jgi:hypothetical protein
VVDLVHEWQEISRVALGRRLVYAADEYYLLAGRPFPAAEAYDGYLQHENGIGMARAFEAAFHGDPDAALGAHRGFFSWVDGAPAAGYRAPRAAPGVRADAAAVVPAPSGAGRLPVSILTGEYGAAVLRPLLAGRDVRVLAVRNMFFGGNIAVTGLMTGADVARVLEAEPPGGRYLLPDVCLSEGRFLDGVTVAELPRPVEVVASDGHALRHALDGGALDGAAPDRAVPDGPAVPLVLGATR